MKKIQLFILTFFIGFSAFSQSIPAYIPSSGLVAWYPFNGNANDVSGNGNTPTNYGATLTSDRFGNLNSSYLFNGNNGQYISCFNNTLPMGKAKRTISLWMNPYSFINSSLSLTAFAYGNPTAGQACMIAIGDNYKGVSLQGWADDLNTYAPYSFNQWVNVIVTFDSLNAKIYVNGNLISATQKPNWFTTGTEFYFGSRVNPTIGYFNGKIDDIAVWNRVLTDFEIKAVYSLCNLRVVSQPTNKNSSFGNTAKFILTTTDTNCAYQWQANNGFGFQNINNAGQYSGSNDDTLSISSLTWKNSNQKFRCIISSGTNCKDTSNIAMLTMSNNFIVPIQIPTNGLVAWYPFNGNTTDESGNGNEAISNNASLTSDRNGNLNKAYTFNGSNSEKITCLNKTLPMGKTKRTISLWMNPYSVISSSQTLTALSYGSAFSGKANMIGFGDNNKGVVFQGWNDDLNNYSSYSFNVWTNVVVTFDSLNVKMYLNGNLIDSTQKSDWITTGTAFYIGTRVDTAFGFFNGKIDDIGIWNRVLTAIEIQNLYSVCNLRVISQPVNKTSGFGSTVKLILTSSDPNCNFQWQLNNGFGFKNLNNAGQFSGTNKDTLTISSLTWTNSNQKFRCIISTSAICRDTSVIVSLTMPNTFTIPSQIPSNGLVAWYPFNGNATDESGNGNEAFSNTANLSSDRFGSSNKAYTFNGTNSEKIACLNKTLPMGKSKRTISLWMNPYSVISSSQTLTAFAYGSANTGNANMLGFGDNNKGVVYQSWVDDLNNYATYSFNQWKHVVVTYDSLNVKMYVNGILIDSAQKPNWNTIGTAFYIGTRVDSNFGFFNGKIDDIGVWNRILTQLEINAVSNRCFSLIKTNPVNDSNVVGHTSYFHTSALDSSTTYQWQTDIGSGFQNLTNSGQYSGTNKDSLKISGLTLTNNNQLFRCILNKGLCMDTSHISRLFVDKSTGYVVYADEFGFHIYPNPSNTILNFRFDSKICNYNYSIIDQTGRIVKEGITGAESLSVSVEELAQGIYFFRLNEKNKLIKFVKN